MFSASPASDQEVTLTQGGTYVLALADNTGGAMPYGFRVFAYTATNTALTLAPT